MGYFDDIGATIGNTINALRRPSADMWRTDRWFEPTLIAGAGIAGYAALSKLGLEQLTHTLEGPFEGLATAAATGLATIAAVGPRHIPLINRIPRVGQWPGLYDGVRTAMDWRRNVATQRYNAAIQNLQRHGARGLARAKRALQVGGLAAAVLTGVTTNPVPTHRPQLDGWAVETAKYHGKYARDIGEGFWHAGKAGVHGVVETVRAAGNGVKNVAYHINSAFDRDGDNPRPTYAERESRQPSQGPVKSIPTSLPRGPTLEEFITTYQITPDYRSSSALNAMDLCVANRDVIAAVEAHFSFPKGLYAGLLRQEGLCNLIQLPGHDGTEVGIAQITLETAEHHNIPAKRFTQQELRGRTYKQAWRDWFNSTPHWQVIEEDARVGPLGIFYGGLILDDKKRQLPRVSPADTSWDRAIVLYNGNLTKQQAAEKITQVRRFQAEYNALTR